MKAKEYIELFKESREENEMKAISSLAHRVLKEAPSIIQKRNCRSDSAVIAVIQELDLKWRAIVKRLPLENERNREIYFRFLRWLVAGTMPRLARNCGWGDEVEYMKMVERRKE